MPVPELPKHLHSQYLSHNMPQFLAPELIRLKRKRNDAPLETLRKLLVDLFLAIDANESTSRGGKRSRREAPNHRQLHLQACREGRASTDTGAEQWRAHCAGNATGRGAEKSDGPEK
jgi:hypothetical protein